MVHQIVELTVLQTTCACFPNGKYARHGCSFSSFPRAWLVMSVRAQPCTNHMRVIAFYNKQYSCAISNPISNQGSTFSGQRRTFLKVKISIKLHRTIMKKNGSFCPILRFINTLIKIYYISPINNNKTVKGNWEIMEHSLGCLLLDGWCVLLSHAWDESASMNTMR